MNQKMVIIQVLENSPYGPKGKQLFEGTVDEFEQVAKVDPLFAQFFPDKSPNYKSVLAMCHEQGWEVEYMERVFNFQLSEREAMLIRGALADQVKKVRTELEIIRITKERDLTEWERALLPHTLRFKNERDESGHLINSTREELQEQIDPWITYVDCHEYLLRQCCEGIESLR